MRHLVTFIVRLWIDPQTERPDWEGQVECVASDRRVHIHSGEDLLRFIEVEVDESIRCPRMAQREE
jgi:hypothetical protein